MNETIQVLPHLQTSAAFHLALEEALHLKAYEELKRTGSFSPIARTYAFAKPTVVLGYRQDITEIDLAYCRENDIDVTMRKTGGGSVLLGENDVQFTFILPRLYTRKLLGNINARIVDGLQDAGFSAEIKEVDQHPVIRLDKKSFVFDAQHRKFVLDTHGRPKACALLHHGTILVDDSDYTSHLQQALKATPAIVKELQTGNAWLRKVQHVRTHELIKALKKNLSFETAKIVHRDYTRDELALAQHLHDTFYAQVGQFSDGEKQFGICYRPSTPYNMELYASSEEEVLA